MPVTVEVSGSVESRPATGTTTFPTETRTVSLASRRTYTRPFGGIMAVPGTDAAPPAMPIGGLAAVRFLYVRATGGEVRLRVTTPDGATQIIPVAGQFVLDNPAAGSEITAVTLAATGTGVEVEYLAAGD